LENISGFKDTAILDKDWERLKTKRFPMVQAEDQIKIKIY